MTFGLDTSVVVRIISGLPETDAARVAARIAETIDDGDECFVSPLVLSEAYYALQHHYAFTKEETLQTLREFVNTPGIRADVTVKSILDSPDVAWANPGFVDWMIVGDYANSGFATYSCEKSFRRLPGAFVV